VAKGAHSPTNDVDDPRSGVANTDFFGVTRMCFFGVSNQAYKMVSSHRAVQWSGTTNACTLDPILKIEGICPSHVVPHIDGRQYLSCHMNDIDWL